MMQQAVWICCVALFCLIGTVSTLIRSSNNSFHAITDCTCPRDIVTYECTVCGLATAWEGTALSACSGGEIALTNQDFVEPKQTIFCNGGTVAARGISAENGCFTSQLYVTFNVGLQGRTVRCSVDNGTHASQVGIAVLALSTGPYPPPRSIYLTGVSPMGLPFSWNQIQNCPSLRYNIVSENCGHCPNTTNGTSVNCSDFTVSNSITLCTFAVQTVICSNNGAPLIGNLSDSLTVNLSVPIINQVTIVPQYNIDDGLRGLTVTISTVDPFIIYEDINGTAISYMVYYSDADTGALCGSSEINSSLCDNGICIEEFGISSSLCRPSSDINVTVSVVTNLGEGPKTNPIMEESRNNFVMVQVVSEPAGIICTFLSMATGTAKSCNATITYGETCQNQISIYGTTDSNNDFLVVVSLRRFLEDTMSSKYCGFRVNATTNTRTVIVEGNLFAIPLNGPGDNRNIIAGVVAAVVILVIIITTVLAFTIIFIWKRHQKRVTISMEIFKSKIIIPVPETCNMIDFAKQNIDNYDPDSGNGYYQFTEANKEYISPKTQVILVSKDEQKICTGLKSHNIIGVSDKREKIKVPDLSNSEWKYVFVQSTSRIQTLLKGTLFLYCEMHDIVLNKEVERQNASSQDGDESLKLIDDKYTKLEQVPGNGDQEYPISDIAKKIEGLSNYSRRLGYRFYEFTKPEFISSDQEVILMDKGGRLYCGPGAQRVIGIGPGQKHEAEEIHPNFDRSKWKRVFIQTRSNDQKLQPGTWFLYCDIASSEMIRVVEPFKVITVPYEAVNDERKIIKIAQKNIDHYNPKAGYAYYEFTGHSYIIPNRNLMALNKKGELFTGPGVRILAGLDSGCDETREVEEPPDLSDTEWDCIFIQEKDNYGRVLEPKTRFLYCEYDYNPKVN